MSKGETILGTSRVDPRFRITLVQPIPELLEVRSGDLIVFVSDEEGKIVIRASNISRVATKSKLASSRSGKVARE